MEICNSYSGSHFGIVLTKTKFLCYCMYGNVWVELQHDQVM